MTCKNLCITHKAIKPAGVGRYTSGQKRCKTCEIFIKYDGIYCPCCGCKLRTHPHTKKYKEILRDKPHIATFTGGI